MKRHNKLLILDSSFFHSITNGAPERNRPSKEGRIGQTMGWGDMEREYA